ncbi:signal transduction histidine kinase, partial [Candidatus Gastranaerophilus sp. (ex Termes propinquus)]
MNSSQEFYKDISKILNTDTPTSASFYTDALKNVAKYLNTNFCGVYFLDALDLTKKALMYKNKEVLADENIFTPDILAKLKSGKEITFEVDSDKIFKRNLPFELAKKTLISKLHIKKSFFGIFFFNGAQTYTKEEIGATEALCSVYSYLIKDQELSSVFKIQLNALQDALLEKDEAHKMIEKQHKKLLEYDRAKNDFLANISHELRTPLNAILGFSQALDCKIFGEMNQKQHEYVQDIHTSGLHLLNMINELLDLAKIESKVLKLNLNKMSPKNAIEEVLNIIAPLSDKKNIKIIFENNCNTEIVADYQKFQQILYNLLSNAIKFTQNDGKITVRSFFTRPLGKEKKYIL